MPPVPPTTLVLSQTDVRSLLPIDTCIELMGEALAALARGAATNPLRRGMLLPGRAGVLGLMPGHLAAPETLGAKVVAVLPDNRTTHHDTHQGIVVLLDPETGVPRAILDASEITALRTAAVSGLATRLLAREEASDLALLGSSVQARTHLAAMLSVRTLRRVRVYSPDVERCAEFCERETGRHGLRIEPCASAHDAVDGADLICTTTGSSTPVLEGAWLAPGSHINAAGACAPKERELDAEAVLRARVFVDSREATWREAGDLLIPRAEGLLDERHVQAELGEVLIGNDPGRVNSGEITLFKSLGLAVEDLAAAQHVWRAALDQGQGTPVDLGGSRRASPLPRRDRPARGAQHKRPAPRGGRTPPFNENRARLRKTWRDLRWGLSCEKDGHPLETTQVAAAAEAVPSQEKVPSLSGLRVATSAQA